MTPSSTTAPPPGQEQTAPKRLPEGYDMNHAESVNPVEAVRARLDDGRRWMKEGIRDAAGNVCMMGALVDAVGMCRRDQPDTAQWRVYRSWQRIIAEQFPDRQTGLGPGFPAEPACFNDHPDTTWSDVDLVLDKAARQWDETHGGVA